MSVSAFTYSNRNYYSKVASSEPFQAHLVGIFSFSEAGGIGPIFQEEF
jgi:hypothetical protein